MIAVALLVLTFGVTGCMATPEGGEVMIMRNGGPFDDKQIRQVVPNGAGNTWIGFGSEAHPYPASDQQRLYKFDDTPDADAKPVEVPTNDGVRVRLTGTFYINTAFDGTAEGERLVRRIRHRVRHTRLHRRRGIGTPVGGGRLGDLPQRDPAADHRLQHPRGDRGVRLPGGSCRRARWSSAAGPLSVSAEEVTGANNRSNVTVIQDRINQNLSEEIQSKLGQPYFRNIRFSLGPVELPGVQKAIDQAQSAFAEVSRAQARVAQAKADADANRERQRGYNDCPACQRIDAIKALPPEPDGARRGLHDRGAMRTAFVLALLVMLIVLIVSS